MKLFKTDFEDLVIIKHNVHKDFRGYFKEKFRAEKLEEIIGKKINFCQENSVKSSINVLRGLHYQKQPFAQSKLISISHGKILDVAVDLRKDYNTYGKYFCYELESDKNESLFIPKGFAHGYLTISDYALVNYQVDNYYNSNMESGIQYNDDFLKIDWGIKENKLIISEKDRSFESYKW